MTSLEEAFVCLEKNSAILEEKKKSKSDIEMVTKDSNVQFTIEIGKTNYYDFN